MSLSLYGHGKKEEGKLHLAMPLSQKQLCAYETNANFSTRNLHLTDGDRARSLGVLRDQNVAVPADRGAGAQPSVLVPTLGATFTRVQISDKK